MKSTFDSRDKNGMNKQCPCCNELFYKRKTEAISTWEKRTFCSIYCSKIKFPLKEYNDFVLNKIITNSTLNINGCLEYNGVKIKNGYGRIHYYRKNVLTHRLVYLLTNNIDTETQLCVLHTCDNPSCVNINHLFIGTHSNNMQDRINKNHIASGFVWKNKKINIDQEENVLKLIETGSKYYEIAKQYNTSTATISNFAVSKGIRKRKMLCKTI